MKNLYNLLCYQMRRIVLFTPEEVKNIKAFLVGDQPDGGTSEIEVRFQKPIQPLTNVKFQQLLSLCAASATSITSSLSTNRIKGSIREITENDQVFYQNKVKVKDNVDIPLWSISSPNGWITARFSNSKEIPVSATAFTQSSDPILTRTKNRSRFTFTDFYIDLTSVETQIGGKSSISFEVEVEFNQNSIKNWLKLSEPQIGFLQSFSVAFGILFSDLHSIVSVGRGKTLSIPKRGIELTKESRPENIQSRHTSEMYMQQMAVTNKLDGLAYNLVIDQVNKKAFLNNDKDYIFFQPQNKNVWWKENTTSFVCMTEVVFANDGIECHIFDCLAVNSLTKSDIEEIKNKSKVDDGPLSVKWDTSITSKPLVDRLAICNTALEFLNKLGIPLLTTEVKTFFTSDNVVQNVHDAVLYTTTRYGLFDISKSNDGFIFEPLQPLYNGRHVPTLKWKFPTHISIDFRLKLTDTTTFGWSTYTCYMNSTRGEIPFRYDNKDATLTLPNENVCDGIPCSGLDGIIAECKYVDGRFSLLRLRLEKVKPNFEKVVLETFADMLNPPTLPLILSQVQTIKPQKFDRILDFKLDSTNLPRLSSTEFISMVDVEGWPLVLHSWQKAKVGFPYFKTFMKEPDYYFSNLVKVKTLSQERLQISTITSDIAKMPRYPEWYFKFSEPWLFGLTRDVSYVSIVSQPNDFNEMDVLTNFFTEPQRMTATVSKAGISPILFWMNDAEAVLQKVYSDKLDLFAKSLREVMFKLCPEATLFKTTLAKTIYDAFKPTRILDWCSGWGDRLIGALAFQASVGKKIDYYGFDPNSSLQSGYTSIIKTLNKLGGNFSVTCSPFETANLENVPQVDLVFTSPPYFDFEVYIDEPTQSINRYRDYKSWMKNFYLPSIMKAFQKLKDEGYFIIHITDTKNMPNLVSFMTSFIQTGLGYKYVGALFTQSTDSTKNPKPIWVYKKIKFAQKPETKQKAEDFFKEKLGFGMDELKLGKIVKSVPESRHELRSQGSFASEDQLAPVPKAREQSSQARLEVKKEPVQLPEISARMDDPIQTSLVEKAFLAVREKYLTDSVILVKPSSDLVKTAISSLQPGGKVVVTGVNIEVKSLMLENKVISIEIVPDLTLKNCCSSPNPLQFIPKLPIFVYQSEDKMSITEICIQTFPQTIICFSNKAVWEALKKKLSFPDYTSFSEGQLLIVIITPKKSKAYRDAFNLFKGEYISQFAKGKIVLDIGSGQGGDIDKYAYAKAKHLFLVEPNPIFMAQCKERYTNLKIAKPNATFIETGGQNSDEIQKQIYLTPNVVFMMFSLTYFFESKEICSKLVQTITKNMAPGEYFICTVMDGYRVRQLLQNGKVTNENFSISYSDPSQQSKKFGSTIYFDLKGSKTASNLTEYLVFIDLLSELLETKGVFLQRVDRLTPKPNFTENETLLSSCYMGCVYIRGKLIGNFTPRDIYRISTTGDGSCLFHAVLQGMFGPMYRDEMGIGLRQAIANNFTLDDYLNCLRGTKSSIDWFQKFAVLKKRKDCGVDWQTIGEEIDKVKAEDVGTKITQANLDETMRSVCYAILLSGYKEAKSLLSNCRKFSEEFVVDYLENYLNINIIQYVSSQSKFVKNSSWKDGPVVPIYNQADIHYETIRWAGSDVSILDLQTGLRWVQPNL